MSSHLRPDVIEDLLAGRLSEEDEAELRAHIASGDCPDCEQGLEALPPALEQRLWAVLNRAEQAAPLRQDACAALVAAAVGPPWWRRPWMLWPASAAAILLLGFFMLLPRPAPEQRDKGTLTRVRVELLVGLIEQGLVRSLRPGEVVGKLGALVFRVQSEAEGCYPVLTHHSAATLGLLWPDRFPAQVPLPLGGTTLERLGQPLGLPLAGLQGEQRFELRCSQAPISDTAEALALTEREPADAGFQLIVKESE